MFRQIGVQHEIHNPLAEMSKGTTMVTCRNPDLLKELLPLSVSCSKTGANRWAGESPGKNCGCCYPCLIRRAAERRFSGDDITAYCWDAFCYPDVINKKARGRDLRNLLRAVHRYRTGQYKFIRECLCPGTLDGLRGFHTVKQVLTSGMEEISDAILDSGCKEVRHYLGNSKG